MKRDRLSVPLIALALGIIVATPGAPQARPGDSQEDRIAEAAAQSSKAAKAFEAIMQVPDKAIPRELLGRAKAVAVFPQVIKVALRVGGEGGRGVVTRRVGNEWGAPVFFRAGGGSVGPQAGASSTDFVLLLMNE